MCINVFPQMYEGKHLLLGTIVRYHGSYIGIMLARHAVRKDCYMQCYMSIGGECMPFWHGFYA